MTEFSLPRIEDLDGDDLASLPKQYRYELHQGSLVIMASSTYWHKVIARRILLMLHATGENVLQDPGVLGDRPRDNRLPDLGVIVHLPPKLASYSNLPGSAFSLVIEIVCEHSENGEYTDKMIWYARQGIPEYWIVDQTGDLADGDALVHRHRLVPPAYLRESSLLLTELEAEYAQRAVR
jgi:Uma2 family endonuclease